MLIVPYLAHVSQSPCYPLALRARYSSRFALLALGLRPRFSLALLALRARSARVPKGRGSRPHPVGHPLGYAIGIAGRGLVSALCVRSMCSPKITQHSFCATGANTWRLRCASCAKLSVVSFRGCFCAFAHTVRQPRGSGLLSFEHRGRVQGGKVAPPSAGASARTARTPHAPVTRYKVLFFRHPSGAWNLYTILCATTPQTDLTD